MSNPSWAPVMIARETTGGDNSNPRFHAPRNRPNPIFTRNLTFRADQTEGSEGTRSSNSMSTSSGSTGAFPSSDNSQAPLDQVDVFRGRDSPRRWLRVGRHFRRAET